MADYTQFVDGILHEPTQTAGRGLALTADAISTVTTPGRVDFGGELAAETTPCETTKRGDDEYGWWHLDAGLSLVQYNERLTVDDLSLTRDELLARGAFHPTLQVTDLPQVPLTVGGAGLKLKENARISTLVATERA